jgi:ABC-2 type transport system ATP-binding protein
MAVAISLRQLAVTYRSGFRKPPVHALLPLDLELPAGRIVGLLGPNGSGKTSLLRVLAGLQRPSGGEARVLGCDPGDPDLRQRVGFQPEGALPFGMLSAPEFLAYMGCLCGLPWVVSDARTWELLRRLDLVAAGRRPVRSFSTGMQKRLALAAALLPEPEVLLLDEPTSGLDPLGSETVMALLQERAAAGACVLLASHHLQEVEQMCAEVLVLHAGVLRARGTLDELLGADATEFVVRGLDPAGTAAVQDAARAAGGEVLRTARARTHLFALFRRLQQQPEQSPPGEQRR